MGDMSVVPILGTSFSTYLPIALAIIVLATVFNLFSKISALIHVRRFQFTENRDISQMEEGAELLRQGE